MKGYEASEFFGLAGAVIKIAGIGSTIYGLIRSDVNAIAAGGILVYSGSASLTNFREFTRDTNISAIAKSLEKIADKEI